MRYWMGLLLAAMALPAGAQTAPVNVQITLTINQPVTVNGAPYTVTGTLTLTPVGTTTGGTTGGTTGLTTGSTTGATTGGATGTTTPAISGVYSPPGNHVASAPSGATVTIAGVGFGMAAGTVTVAGLPATVTAWADGSIAAVLPTVTRNTVGPVVVTLPSGTTLSLPGFTITAVTSASLSGAIGNLGMGVAGYATGAGYRTDVFAPGDLVNLYGWSFGAQAGTVQVDTRDCPVQAWSDRLISLTLPADLGENAEGVYLDVARPDGVHYSAMGFKVIPRG